jgi:Tfp pilus assembly protein FimT
MTLLELMLVLALLVAIGAMAMPAFQVPFEYHRLRQGGELVRVEWNKARIKAMKTGQTLMFRYTPAAGAYQVLPYFTQQDWLEADAAHSPSSTLARTNPQLQTATQAADAAAQAERQLPEGVVFVSGEVEADTRSLQIEPTASNISNGSGPPPVLFYPDGTTSDARLVLTNQYQRLFIVVSVRSLTGLVRVSPLVSSDELPSVP